MYNSVTVSLIMKLVTTLEKWYRHSGIHGFFKRLSFIGEHYRASATYRFLTSEKPVLEGSFFLKLIQGLFLGLSWICKKLHQVLFVPLRDSLFFRGIDTFNQSLNQILALISLILLYTGLFTLVASIFQSRRIKLSLLLMGVGLIGSLLQGKYEACLEHSKVLDFFLDFFRKDKGEESWW